KAYVAAISVGIVDGKPMLLVYRPALLPDAKATAGRWRATSTANSSSPSASARRSRTRARATARSGSASRTSPTARSASR
ncbi:MAG TPA: hypothetical protein EYQ24_02605, partial [Bacteroidetes bacterium]|nr:hypothetical protein [Bacteroidota bacterium]